MLLLFSPPPVPREGKKNGVRVSSDRAQLEEPWPQNEMIFRVPPPPVVVFVRSSA